MITLIVALSALLYVGTIHLLGRELAKEEGSQIAGHALATCIVTMSSIFLTFVGVLVIDLYGPP